MSKNLYLISSVPCPHCDETNCEDWDECRIYREENYPSDEYGIKHYENIAEDGYDQEFEDEYACSADIYCEGDGCCEKPELPCGCHPLHRNCTLCLSDEEVGKRLEDDFSKDAAAEFYAPFFQQHELEDRPWQQGDPPPCEGLYHPCRAPDCECLPDSQRLPEPTPEQSGNPGYRPKLCCNIANCQSPNCLDIYKGVIDCFPF